MIDPKVFDFSEDKNRPLKGIWQAFVGIVLKILENPKEDQVATKIPLKGKISDPESNYWKTIVNVLRNAFVEAYKKEIEDKVTLVKD